MLPSNDNITAGIDKDLFWKLMMCVFIVFTYVVTRLVLKIQNTDKKNQQLMRANSVMAEQLKIH